MSVLLSDRKESKFEVIVYAEKLAHMMDEFAARDFGVKDIWHLVRKKYDPNKGNKEQTIGYYDYKLKYIKGNIIQLGVLLQDALRSANAIYPTSMAELEKRRSYQDDAIVYCVRMMTELQQTVTLFDVNLNAYGRYVDAINREIDLIKRWRQRDNRLKAKFQG